MESGLLPVTEREVDPFYGDGHVASGKKRSKYIRKLCMAKRERSDRVERMKERVNETARGRRRPDDLAEAPGGFCVWYGGRSIKIKRRGFAEFRRARRARPWGLADRGDRSAVTGFTNDHVRSVKGIKRGRLICKLKSIEGNQPGRN